MSDIEFRFADAHTFAASMAAAPALVEREMVDATNRLTIQGETFAKQNLQANGSIVSRTLFRSIAHTPAVMAGGTVTGRYGTAVPYGPLVENGRGPVVARGRALAFHPKGSSQVIFRKRVGPAAPPPFIRPSVERIRPLVQREYGAALQRIVAGIGGGS